MESSLYNNFANHELEQWIDKTTTTGSFNKKLLMVLISENKEKHEFLSSTVSSMTSLSNVFADITNVSDSIRSRPRSKLNSNTCSSTNTISLRRKRNKSVVNNSATSQSFLDLGIYEQGHFCKDQVLNLKDSQLLLLPRVFQHHNVNRNLRTYYESQNFKIIRNKNLVNSPCGTINSRSFDSDCNWMDYKYLRVNIKDETQKEIMCRFCYGKNWINWHNIFEHLFISHGITSWLEQDDTINSDSDGYYGAIDILDNIRLVHYSFISLPEKYFAMKLKSGMRRTYVKCLHCQKWVRLGWCEYDEILIDEQDGNDENFSDQLSEFDYHEKIFRQIRDRSLINGIYENFFIHSVNCTENKNVLNVSKMYIKLK